MHLKVLNRIKKGGKIMAEVPHEDPDYRRWISIMPSLQRSPLDPNYKPINHLYEIHVLEQVRFEHELLFYEHPAEPIMVYELADEDSMMKKAAELVPSTDVFDVPWRVYLP